MSVVDADGVSVTELGVVDTRSQPVASCRLNAGWLTCCYSRRATRQTENTHNGQQKPNLRHKKEGVKRIGRSAGNSES